MVHYIEIDTSRKPVALNELEEAEHNEISEFINKYTGNAIPETSVMIPIKPAMIANVNVKFLPMFIAQKLATAGQLYLDASNDFEVYLVAAPGPYRRIEYAEGFVADLQTVSAAK